MLLVYILDKMLHLNILQLFLLTGFGISLFLFFSLRKIEERYRKAALYLGLFIIGYLALQVDLNVIPVIQRKIYFIIPNLPILYFLPVFFIFFIITSIDPDFRPGKRYKWLYLPGTLDVIYSLVSWMYVSNVKEGTVYEFLTGRAGFFVHEGGAILFSLFCLGLLATFLQGARFHNNQTYRFFKYVIAGFSIIVLRWITPFIGNVFQLSWYNYRIEHIFYILESLFLLFVGYKVLTAPRVLQFGKQTESGGDQKEIQQKAKEMRDLIRQKKLYLSPDLSRRDLAEEMNLTEVQISRLLNEGLSSNFYELINRYRISESEDRIRSGRLNEITIQALAHEVGFKSKSTFNKTFKEQTGLIPSEYRHKYA